LPLRAERLKYKMYLINKIKLTEEANTMSEIIEMGTVSSRGQICIPNDIREEMGLKEGSRVLFVLQDDNLLVKKVSTETFAEITRPLKEAAKKAGMKESDVEEIVTRFRKSKR
jgi:AbrB family looped-hinge helix DNA binding protein